MKHDFLMSLFANSQKNKYAQVIKIQGTILLFNYDIKA